MREILFRGKRTDTGAWVKGLLARYNPIFETANIVGLAECLIPVHTSTVGQFTGLYDKNGRKIFEGDIVCHYNENPFTKSTDIEKGEVFWDKDFCGWRRTTNHVFHSGVVDTYRMSSQCVYEVIGNIHDNPELLEAQS